VWRISPDQVMELEADMVARMVEQVRRESRK